MLSRRKPHGERETAERKTESQRQGEIISNRQADTVGRQPQAMCSSTQSKQ